MPSKLTTFKQKLTGGSRSKKKGCGCSDCKEGKACKPTPESPPASSPQDELIEEMLGQLLSTDRQGVLKYLEELKSGSK